MTKPNFTKAELMAYMRTYKKEHCKAISRMKKEELEKLAISHGFLHSRHGIEKKTPTRTATTGTPTTESKRTPPTHAELKEEKKKIYEEINKNTACGADVSQKEANAMLANRKKLFSRISEINKILKKK